MDYANQIWDKFTIQWGVSFPNNFLNRPMGTKKKEENPVSFGNIWAAVKRYPMNVVEYLDENILKHQ